MVKKAKQPALKISTCYLALFLFLFAIYLLTYTPRINSSDGLAMFATAESLVRRGALDIEQIRWMGLQQGTYGLDGLLYSRKGIGVPAGLLPLTWLGLMVPWFGTVSASLLFNSIVTALTAVLLLAYIQQLGFSRRAGLMVALTFGLTTLAWPYAKSLFSDPFSGLLLLAAAYLLLKFGQADGPALGYLFLAGLLLGWNVATRYAEALFLPVYGLLWLYYWYPKNQAKLPEPESTPHRPRHPGFLASTHHWKTILPAASAFLAPILLTGLALIAFNVSRYGDPLNTGYLPNETFSGVLWQGIVGQLLSPGRGLLLYCPIFILSFWGLPAFFRRFRAEALLATSIILIHLLLYGKWFMWHGGYAWGPRFMIPTLPFWALFLAPVAARAFPDNQRQTGSAARRLLFLALAALSLIPQILSVLIDFTPFQNSLLDTGLPLFAPQTFFDPKYSPFVAAWAFISLDAVDTAWAWGGQINGWLLAALVVNIAITGFYLNEQTGPKQKAANPTPIAARPSRPAITGLLACLSTLIVLIFLLIHTHNLPPRSLQEAVTALNDAVRPSDVIITNDPEMAIPLAERYKGRAPVLGLNNGGFPLPDDINRRLADTIEHHRQVWWLPNWLPPGESAIEQTLLSAGLQVRNDSFGDQRLALFVNPVDASANITPTNATFAGLMSLTQVIYPPILSRGAAFPVELQWRGLAPMAEDYHVFIHIVAGNDQIVAQADGQPVAWLRPTSSWAAGETIIDRYGLWVGPDTAPGDYQLRIGLYRPADGRRLLLADGQDSVRFKVAIE